MRKFNHRLFLDCDEPFDVIEAAAFALAKKRLDAMKDGPKTIPDYIEIIETEITPVRVGDKPASVFDNFKVFRFKVGKVITS